MGSCTVSPCQATSICRRELLVEQASAVVLDPNPDVLTALVPTQVLNSQTQRNDERLDKQYRILEQASVFVLAR